MNEVTEKTATLYERLGGEEGIIAIVDISKRRTQNLEL